MSFKLKLSSQKLLYLAIFSFVFVASFAFSTTKLRNFERTETLKPEEPAISEDFPPVPVLKGNVNEPDITAESAIAIDQGSGITLFEKNPDEKVLPASTTKMVTALTALDYYNLDDVITVRNIKVEGQKMRLVEGEKMKVSDLISGLLIYSANDAAEALSQNYCDNNNLDRSNSCGRAAFIAAMNAKAFQMHLDNTHFTNPTGLNNPDHLSTARDLARVASEGMKNRYFRQLVGTKETTVLSLDGKTKHKLTNLNQLLGEVPGVMGIKTGWTPEAKENLVSYIERQDKKIIIVVLGSSDRFGESRQLIDWIFGSYDWKAVRI